MQRLTVYRHFPDERALLSACSLHYRAANPPPDPDVWARVFDPEERLRAALADTYAHHRRTEPMMSKVLRDAEVHAPFFEATGSRRQHWDRARYALVAGWGQRTGGSRPCWRRSATPWTSGPGAPWHSSRA